MAFEMGTDRDYTADFGGENGQYVHKCRSCGLDFVGHKRRIVCKACTAELSAEIEGAE